MEDLFKKVMYTSVGFVTNTADKFQKAIDDLVSKGKLSREEGKKVVDDLITNTESKREEFEGKLGEMVEKVVGKFNLPTKSDFDKLLKRLDQLESKVADKTKK